MISILIGQVFDIKLEQSRIELDISTHNMDIVKVEAKSYGYEEKAKEYYKYRINENTKLTIPQTSKLIIRAIGNIACSHSAVVLNKCEGDFAKIRISGVVDSIDIECKLCSIEFNVFVNRGKALVDNGIVKGTFRANNFYWTFMNANANFKDFSSPGRIINKDGHIKIKASSNLKVIYSKDLGSFKVFGKKVDCFACSGEEGSSDKLLYVDQSNGSFEISR